jgi:hypothetical protein
VIPSTVSIRCVMRPRLSRVICTSKTFVAPTWEVCRVGSPNALNSNASVVVPSVVPDQAVARLSLDRQRPCRGQQPVGVVAEADRSAPGNLIGRHLEVSAEDACHGPGDGPTPCFGEGQRGHRART